MKTPKKKKRKVKMTGMGPDKNPNYDRIRSGFYDRTTGPWENPLIGPMLGGLLKKHAPEDK